jgi:hypothetical protein
MAWIESHQEMKDNPKTIRLARRLKIEVPHAIGCLHCLWWWAISYAQDGTLYQYDNIDIAYAMMWQGDPDEFVEALKIERFLDVDENGYSIHDWWNYAGKLLEKRRNDSGRKKNAAGYSTDNSRDGRGASTDIPRNFHGSDAEQTRKKNVTVPYLTVPNNKNTLVRSGERTLVDDAPEDSCPPAENPSEDGGARTKDGGKGIEYTTEFEEFWEAYPRRVRKKDAFKHWKPVLANGTVAAEIVVAAKTYAMATRYLERAPDKIMHPQTFIMADRWREWLPPSGQEYLDARETYRTAHRAPSAEPNRYSQYNEVIWDGPDDYAGEGDST